MPYVVEKMHVCKNEIADRNALRKLLAIETGAKKKFHRSLPPPLPLNDIAKAEGCECRYVIRLDHLVDVVKATLAG